MKQLEFKNVTKKYEDFEALNDVSFTINKGEFVFIVGHSGAGKSTLIKLLTREEVPDEGTIIFDEQNIYDIPQKQVSELRRRIGVVFQDFKVLDSKTVFENVAVALEVTHTDRTTINEIVPNVLNLVGLQDKANTLPFKLSGGEKQRLTIARALAHEPDILVADEPTGMIDPKASDEVIEILLEINKRGTTVLMATHDHEIVDKLEKRVIRISKGRVVSDEMKGKYA